MQQVSPAALAVQARAIPPLTHAEAAARATEELARFLALVAPLCPAEWALPTACPRWDVRQVMAHVSGAAAAYASWAQFRRQYSPMALRPYRPRVCRCLMR